MLGRFMDRFMEIEMSDSNLLQPGAETLDMDFLFLDFFFNSA